MDFELSKEQKMLQSSVRQYLKDKIDPVADERDRQGPLTKEESHRYLRELEPFGYVGTLVPEALGGSGMSHIEWAIIHEELRRVWAGLGGMVGITASTAHSISQTKNEALRDRILPGLLTGDKIACTAITEPDVGSNAGAISTEAVVDGDDYVINGTKMWISNGTVADYVVVVATTDPSKGREAICHLLVERDVSSFESQEI
jgi:alkylation response protein AidB-like acyl-CoA dehydrogenase